MSGLRRRRLLLLMVFSVVVHVLVVLLLMSGQPVPEQGMKVDLVEITPVARAVSVPRHPVAAKAPAKPAVPSVKKKQLAPVVRNKPVAARSRSVPVQKPPPGAKPRPADRDAAKPSLSPAAEKPVRSSHGVGIVSRARPKYPLMARRRGLQGRVVLVVRVGRDGRVLAVHVSKSSGYGVLDRAAVDGIRRWSFRPARRLGVAIASEITIPVRFELRAAADEE